MARLISRRAEELLIEASSLAPERRAAFVANACGDDHGLRDEVLSLLAAAGPAEIYFDGLAEKISLAALANEAEDLPESRQIGHWRLLRLIGRGGMGSVYLAERTDEQFEKRVALKILPLGAAGERARARFLVERQILARLVHDNIARLLDGGVTNDGSPYFVMDYVDGVPIDEYCVRQNLSVRERLNLVLNIARAVQFAHRNLVVHRDLKPANILVEAGGRVRLLDFGVAKVLEETAEGEALTQIAQRPVTPAYASPEMLRGDVVDVTTDVYSIGVVLFHLLTGRLPLTYDGLTLPDMYTHANNAVPPLISRHAGELSGQFSGDLDAIVAKALAKLPAERYQSVESLANDIRHYLKGMPVAAKMPTLLYRTRKFVGRHLVGASFALFAVVALVSVAGLAAYSAVNAGRQARAIALERDKAEQTRDFLLRIFEVSGPNQAKGDTITARELLDRSTANIRSELPDQPALRAELMATSGQVYAELSLLEPAKALLRDAVALHRQASGETSPGLAYALDKLVALIEKDGDFAQAQSIAAEAVGIRKTLDDPAALATSLSTLGRIVHRQGDLDRGEALYREALAIHRAVHGSRHEQIARDLSHLGALIEHRGDYPAAEALHREALAIRREQLGDEHLATMESLHNLAQSLVSQSKFEAAFAHFEEALAISRKLLPDGDSGAFYFFNGMANAQRKLGNVDQAEALYLEAHEVLKRYFEADHPENAMVLAQLGRIAMLKGDPQAAEPLLREGLTLLGRAVPNHPYLPDMRVTLGQCLTKIGRYTESEQIISASHRQLSAQLGPDHPRTQFAVENLVALFEASGDAGRAQHYRKLLAQ